MQFFISESVGKYPKVEASSHKKLTLSHVYTNGVKTSADRDLIKWTELNLGSPPMADLMDCEFFERIYHVKNDHEHTNLMRYLGFHRSGSASPMILVRSGRVMALPGQEKFFRRAVPNRNVFVHFISSICSVPCVLNKFGR